MRAIVAKTLDSLLTHYLMNAINRFQLNRVQQLYSINQNRICLATYYFGLILAFELSLAET